MSDNNAPTQPHNDPVPMTEADTLPLHPPTRSSLTAGHWYSYPGQQQSAAPPAVEAPAPVPDRRDLRHKTARDRVRQRKVRRETGAPDDWAWVVIASALLGMTVVLSMTVFFLLQASRGASKNSTSATAGPPSQPTSVLYGPGGILAGDTEPVGEMENSMVINRWAGGERFTVLVMGNDQRPGEFGASYRTDTMILISLDPKTNRIGILSIPRDLWVEIPGYGVERVNAAYAIGELEGPGGGPLLAMRTIQFNFGIPVNEYVTIDFETFVNVIDLIGGIHIEVPQAIYDPEYPDMNYGYDPFYLDAGWQQLDGETALKYARTRHGSDDIDRGRRQQQVLFAVRDKVLSANMIPELAARAISLWAEFNEGIDTGLSLDQILELAWWVKDIPTSNYHNGVIGWEYVISLRYQNKDILVPVRDEKLVNLMIEIFGQDYNVVN